MLIGVVFGRAMPGLVDSLRRLASLKVERQPDLNGLVYWRSCYSRGARRTRKTQPDEPTQMWDRFKEVDSKPC